MTDAKKPSVLLINACHDDEGVPHYLTLLEPHFEVTLVHLDSMTSSRPSTGDRVIKLAGRRSPALHRATGGVALPLCGLVPSPPLGGEGQGEGGNVRPWTIAPKGRFVGAAL